MNAVNEISLSWRDNSNVKDGYIIERKQAQQASFAVLDTLAGSGNEYVDKELALNQTYA